MTRFRRRAPSNSPRAGGPTSGFECRLRRVRVIARQVFGEINHQRLEGGVGARRGGGKRRAAFVTEKPGEERPPFGLIEPLAAPAPERGDQRRGLARIAL